MAYLIFTANGDEYERRELRPPDAILIGRAPDCNVAVRDIILSRHHCRIERTEDAKGWQIVDLHSKNGTFLRGQPIEMHVLHDGDELRIGRSRLTYKSGAMVAAPKNDKPKKSQPAVSRPMDPHEALAGTVTGMVVCEPGETQKHAGMPMPQPRPVDPNSFQSDGVYDMINEIASSSWDSIQTQASQPTRMQRAMPVPGVTSANRGSSPTTATAPIGPAASPRPKPRISFALQAGLEGAKESAELTASVPPPLQADPLAAPKAMRQRRKFSWDFWAAAASAAVLVLCIAGWITVATRASNRLNDEINAPPPPRTGRDVTGASQPARDESRPLAVEPGARNGAAPVSLTNY